MWIVAAAIGIKHFDVPPDSAAPLTLFWPALLLLVPFALVQWIATRLAGPK
jgi:hypothetical protein